MTGIVLANQFLLLVGAFVFGSIVALVLTVANTSQKTWKVVDLIWVFFGGLSAGAAIFLSVYLSKAGSTERSIDLLKSKISSTHDYADIFWIRYCSSDASNFVNNFYTNSFNAICAAAANIANDTSADSTAFAFVGLLETRNVDPTSWFLVDESVREQEDQSDRWDLTDSFTALLKEAEQTNDNFEMLKMRKTFFGLDLQAPVYLAAEQELVRSGIYTDFALEYRALKEVFFQLQAQFDEIEAAWEGVLRERWILALRTWSLSLFALCLPLRLGKSWNDIVNSQPAKA